MDEPASGGFVIASINERRAHARTSGRGMSGFGSSHGGVGSLWARRKSGLNSFD
jgi:hypothetical protein